MTNPNRRQLQIREVPSGWPVGSFDTYAEAQAAVDSLSDREFPVEKLTIVGVDLMQVENITGRLTWGRVLGGGALSGLWMGTFIGLIFALFAMPGTGWSVLLWSLLIGAVFGLVFAAIAYAFSGGQRDFSSATAIVAGHYDVLCEADMAPQARDLIAAGVPAGVQGQRSAKRPEQPTQQPEQPIQQPEQPDSVQRPDSPGNAQ